VVKGNDWVKLNKAFAVKELLQVETLVSQKKDLCRQTVMIKEVNSTLQKSIDSGNATRRSHYINLLPTTLNKIQADECFRLGVSKDTIRQICSYFLKALQNDINTFTGIQVSASTVDPQDECQNLVNILSPKTLPTIPLDFHFSDSVQEIFRKCEIRKVEEEQSVAKKIWEQKYKGFEREIKEIQSQIDCIEVLIQNLSGIVKPGS
jgi:ribosomal protein L28